MKKWVIYALSAAFLLSCAIVFIGADKEETPPAPEKAEEAISEEDMNKLDPYIADVWASADQFRYPIDPNFRGPHGEKVTLDTESLPLTVAEVKKIQNGNYKIAVSWNTLDAEYFMAWRKGTIDACEYLNIDIIAEASASFDPVKQLADIESFIPLKPDVIISAPIDTVTSAEAFRPALAQGIKLAFVSNIPDGYVRDKDYIGVATSNCHDYGVFAYELLHDFLGPGGKLAAMPWETNYWFTNYYNSVFFDLVDKGDLDLVVKAGYRTYDDSYAVANGIIMRHPEVEGIYVDYCTPGLGVINAIKDNKREDIILVVGGYDKPSLLALIDGDFDGLYSDITYLVGFNSVLLACYGILGKEGPEYAVCPAVKFTLENMRDIWNIGMRIPFPEEIDKALKAKGY
jgi:ribose transport system substrate-binding protein